MKEYYLVIVGEAPRFTTELSTVTAEHGKPVTLSCVVIGNPRPTVTWILDGEPLIESDTYVTKYHDDGTVILTITKTYQEDEGEYIVEATNPFGTVRTTAELTLSGRFAFPVLLEILLTWYENHNCFLFFFSENRNIALDHSSG